MKKVKGVIFMLSLVIELGSIIVGRVVAKEVKKWWEEDWDYNKGRLKNGFQTAHWQFQRIALRQSLSK